MNFSQGIRFCQLSKSAMEEYYKQLKILVVDDEDRMRKLVRDFLVRNLYEVE